MSVPYTFATATTSIPLSQLDSNFATPITLGNTSVYLGNTTSSIGNLTLTNVTVNVGTLNNVSIGSTTPNTGSFTNVSYTGTLTGSTGVLNIGSGQIYKDASGNVGIGTVGPSYALHVSKASAGGAIWTASQNTDATAGSQAGFLAVASGTNNYSTLSQVVGGSSAYVNSGAGTLSISNVQAQPLLFLTSATERMRIDASGNLGLGVTPSAWDNRVAFQNGSACFASSSANRSVAEISANSYLSSGGIFRYLYSSANATLYQQATGQHVWFTAPSGTAGNAITFTQAMTLDASGNLGIGTTSPAFKLDVTGQGRATTGFAVSTDGSTFTPAGLNAIPNYGVGYITSTSQTVLSGFGGIPFYTNQAERMRIDSSGNLLVGTTDSALTTGNGIKALASATPALLVNTSGSTSATTSLLVYSTGASAYRFYVRNDGAIFATNTTIQSISDVQLKENVRSLDYGLAQIMELQPRRFDWKDGKGLDKKNDIGFIAQEFESVVPEFVDESIDTNEDGSNIKTVGAAGLIPILVKAIQEQQAIIEQLKADVAALKGKV
jgi:Chaperone of endosialidase